MACIWGTVSCFRFLYIHQLGPMEICGVREMLSVLVPRLASWWAKEAFSPWTMPMMARSVATPMPTAATVRSVRSGFARSEPRAMRPPS